MNMRVSSLQIYFIYSSVKLSFSRRQWGMFVNRVLPPLALWPWVDYLRSWSLSFFICKLDFINSLWVAVFKYLAVAWNK